MKRILLCITLVMFLGVITTSLSAGDKKINLFGNVGIATSDVEGLFVDVGAELQFTNNIYGQLLFDYYFNPTGEDIEGVNDSAYGFNLYGVYKFSSSSALNLFVKAGVHYTTIKASAEAYGISVSVSDSDFGIGGGLGIEYSLSEKMALLLGGTVKVIFSEGETGTWFKFYGGFNFQLN
jgi:opacity protein-like surface antigen